MASRSSGNSIARSLLAVKLSGSHAAVQAAAGHGRSSNSGNGGSSSGGGSGASNSSNSGIGGCGNGAMIGGSGSSGGSGGGAVGGGAGGGGMPPGGNGGRGNYGPSSPPTGSLPPFYESLKGGNNLANFANQYNTAQGALFHKKKKNTLLFLTFSTCIYFARVKKTINDVRISRYSIVLSRTF